MDKKVIHTVFEDRAGKYPENKAVEAAGESITYRQLNELANRIAALLQSLGVRENMIVTTVLPSSIQWVAGMLSIFKAGGIYLPVDLAFSEKRLAQIFRETYDGILITNGEQFGSVVTMLEKMSVPVTALVVLDNDGVIGCYRQGPAGMIRAEFEVGLPGVPDLVSTVDGDSSNYIFYTSGSTGEGKAILGRSASLSHFIHWEVQEFGLDASLRVSQLTATTFDASFRDVFTALITGGTLCIPPPGTMHDPDRLLKWLGDRQVSLVHCVPSLFRLLTRQIETERMGHYDISHLRYIILSGEMLYVRDIQHWRKVAGERIGLVNFYGATETTLIKTFFRIGQTGDNPTQIVPVGKPIGNTSVAILKEGRMCQKGEIGELYVKTPFATKGYYKNEALTKQVFVPNPLTNDASDIVYKTGDLGRYLEGGYIEVLGRLDSQVKINGVRVELGEIEQAILDLEGVTGAAVKPHRTEDNLSVLIAYYTGDSWEGDRMRTALLKTLNSPIIPSYFVHLDKFPLNTNGKTDKKALPLPDAVLTADILYEEPQGAFETALARLWMEILGVKRIGRHASFFSIGGHSLRAVQLISRIQKSFGVGLKIADVFNNKTIKELASVIAGSSLTRFRSIEPAGEQAAYLLSSSQLRLWIQSQFREENLTFNIPGVCVLEGGVDVAALENACLDLIARHEILRTVFLLHEDGKPRQKVLDPADAGFALTFLDLQQEPSPETAAAGLVTRAMETAFDLQVPPLLRAWLLALTPRRWVFAFVMHHMISDDWSLEIFIKELLLLYHARRRKEPMPLAPLRIQYKDYAAWQQERLASGVLSEARDYWLEQLSGVLPMLSIPGDRPRPPQRTIHGAAVQKEIRAESLHALRAVLDKQGASLFMGLFMSVNLLLNRLSGQRDLIVGSPVSGREHEDTEGQIGFYVNTIALRTRLDASETLTDLLSRIRSQILIAYAHSSFPFEELVELLDPVRDPGRNVLFDVWMVLHEHEIFLDPAPLIRDGLSVTGMDIDLPVYNKFDLNFSFIDHKDSLSLIVEYNSDIFDRRTVEEMCGQLGHIVAVMGENMSCTLSELNMQLDELSTREREDELIRIRSKNRMNLIKRN